MLWRILPVLLVLLTIVPLNFLVSAIILSQNVSLTGPSVVVFRTSSPNLLTPSSIIYSNGSATFYSLNITRVSAETVGLNNVQTWSLQIVPSRGVCYLSGLYVIRFSPNVTISLSITTQ